MFKKLTAAPLLALFVNEAKAHQYSAHSPDSVDLLATLTAKTESVQAALEAQNDAAAKGEFQASIDDLLCRGRAAVAEAAADKECISDMLSQITDIEEQIKRHHQAAFNAQNDAVTAQTASETARDGAVVAQGAAETAKLAAESAQTLAEEAETAANTARIGADTAAAAAEVAHLAADEAATVAETAATATSTAKTAAMQAATDSAEQKTAALASQSEAEFSKAQAMTSAESANNSADNATTSAENAATSLAAALFSQAEAEYFESLAMYNTFRHETDFDYDFIKYAVWITSLEAEFALLTSAGTITAEKPMDSFVFESYTITDGRCQQFEFKGTQEGTSRCHGKGYFVIDGDEYRVSFNQGAVVKVVKDKDGKREAYTCRGEGTKSCTQKHGPYSLISGGTKSNIMYDKDVVVGSELDVEGNGKTLWYNEAGNIIRGKADNALSNFCTDIGTIEGDYRNYCADAQVNM